MWNLKNHLIRKRGSMCSPFTSFLFDVKWISSLKLDNEDNLLALGSKRKKKSLNNREVPKKICGDMTVGESARGFTRISDTVRECPCPFISSLCVSSIGIRISKHKQFISTGKAKILIWTLSYIDISCQKEWYIRNCNCIWKLQSHMDSKDSVAMTT